MSNAVKSPCIGMFFSCFNLQTVSLLLFQYYTIFVIWDMSPFLSLWTLIEIIYEKFVYTWHTFCYIVLAPSPPLALELKTLAATISSTDHEQFEAILNWNVSQVTHALLLDWFKICPTCPKNCINLTKSILFHLGFIGQ